MIFKSEPNLFVKISNKYVQRATGKKGFHFDENGEFRTDNEVLCKLLKQHFEIKDENNAQGEEIQEEKKIFKCKKCNFTTTESMGVLLFHYRIEHKKEG